MGSARDLVEHAGVPRFYFSDFPLGHSAGKPFDPESQDKSLADALSLLGTAVRPGTTMVSSQIWQKAQDWKADFLNVDQLSAEEIMRRKAEHQQHRLTGRKKKLSQD